MDKDGEVEYWTNIQKERGCFECLCFDPSREGQSRFCTYAFALDLKFDKDGKQICVRPMTKSEGPMKLE